MEAGDFVAVCGPSGCGKSTLLLTLGGLLRPDAGMRAQSTVPISTVCPPIERARFRARTIGFVFQQFYLIPYLNVLRQCAGRTLGTGSRKSPSGSRAGGTVDWSIGIVRSRSGIAPGNCRRANASARHWPAPC